MAEEKLLSVIVPVYNTAAYLPRCISSIQKQIYRNLEIICVDNGSSDDSYKILKSFEKEDSRIVVLEEKKKGVSAARNRGLDEVHGEYVTFVDSDDSIVSQMYKGLINALEKEHADIAHCGYRRYEADGSFRDISGTGEYLIEDKWQAIEHLLKGEKYIGSICNKIYKHKLFGSLRLDESIAHNEDVLLNFQLFDSAQKTVFIDEPYYWYYAHIESATASRNTHLKRNNVRVVSEKIWTLFENSEVKEIAANKYYYDMICAYREGVLEKRSACDNSLKEIRNNIKILEESNMEINLKNKLDFRLMRTAPMLYRLMYPVYDRIRKPNWDVK